MSPRRNRPNRPQPPTYSESGFGNERTEPYAGGEWVVRSVAGTSAAKHYRCPGCEQEIPPGVGHVVAWPQHGDVDDRRHWHRACWNARDRRRPDTLRARNAPRY
ncbi:ATP/GTP-binding protein [Allostreptomyces psammosilenae]|uniref:ATP/GTP-binding protein n=1 Tax=Allostreptomyces psammosilenae TaxID=1892865 RepID=A0A852ZVS2_9ACTN|nr:ATP/GTP-binding protein [Allostreptomyces psammosilenae]NYI06476.1 hypothetical protein [Allostreptomyces psammosilenae]